MFRGGFFPLLLTFFIVAAIFVSTLNASLSHQELSAAPREKRFESHCTYNGQRVPCDENGKPIPPTDNLVRHDKIIASAGLSHQELSAAPREKRLSPDESGCFYNGQRVGCDENGNPIPPPGSGAKEVGYGIGLMAVALFAYLFH